MEPQEIYLKRVCTPEEATLLIGDTVPNKTPTFTKEALIYDADTKELIAAVTKLTNTQHLRAALHQINYGQFSRANNYASQSATFGYAPRRPVLQREGCTSSAIHRDHPNLEQLLENTADQCAQYFQTIAPHIVEQDRETTKEVLTEWRIGESKLWTSGVVNRTSQLPYHRDNFNFPAWSAMPTFKYGTQGGHLHIPEYDLTLPCRDSQAAFFKGKTLVHGVTPIKLTKPDGYRYSIVYYALQGMKDCYTHAKETAYAQQKRSEREREMAKRIAQGDTTIPTHGTHTK